MVAVSNVLQFSVCAGRLFIKRTSALEAEGLSDQRCAGSVLRCSSSGELAETHKTHASGYSARNINVENSVSRR